MRGPQGGLDRWRLADVVGSVVDLALPRRCAGCASPGSRCCDPCRAAFAPAPRRHLPTPPPTGFPGCWSIADYSGAARSLVLAFKEHGRRDLAGLLAQAVARACIASVVESVGRPCPVLVVPAPTSRAARRRRGYDHTGLLAEQVVRVLVGLGWHARVARVLRVDPSVADQAGLDAAQRHLNTAGSQVATPLPGVPLVVVLDDVVTTGATLAESARALRAAGAGAVVAVTLCATRRRLPLVATQFA